MISTEQIQVIKEKLPRGYLKKVAENTGFSERTISKFLAAETYHTKIHQALLDLIEEHNGEMMRLQKRTEEITSK